MHYILGGESDSTARLCIEERSPRPWAFGGNLHSLPPAIVLKLGLPSFTLSNRGVSSSVLPAQGYITFMCDPYRSRFCIFHPQVRRPHSPRWTNVLTADIFAPTDLCTPPTYIPSNLFHHPETLLHHTPRCAYATALEKSLAPQFFKQ